MHKGHEWNGLPIPIDTERLRLDRLEPRHAKAVFAYRNLPEVRRFQGAFPRSVEHAREHGESQLGRVPLSAPGWFQLVIERNARVVGDIGLHGIDADQFEIGISLAPDAQGKGYATEALSAILDAALPGRHRVIASVDPRNTACVALLERLGMRREALHLQSVRDGEEWADDLIFALLKTERRSAPATSAGATKS